MNWSKQWILLVCVGFVSLGSGCFLRHYSLSGVNIPNDVNTFSVRFFPNEAALVNPRLSQVFTEKLRSKFLNETRLAMVENEGDFRFSGAIRDYRIEPVAVQNNTAATQNRLQMSVNVKFEAPGHPELNFESPFSFFIDYDAGTDFQGLEASLSEQLSDQIVQQIFNKVALNW